MIGYNIDISPFFSARTIIRVLMPYSAYPAINGMLVTSAIKCGEKWFIPVLINSCAAAPRIVQVNTSRKELRRAFLSGCEMAIVAVVLNRGTLREGLAN